MADLLPLINTLLDMKQFKMDSPPIFTFSAYLEASEASENCSNELNRSCLPLGYVFSIKFDQFVPPDQHLTGHEADLDGFASDFHIFDPL